MASQPEVIRITDLNQPVLTPVQRAAIDAAAQQPVVLSESAVLGAAVEHTGLDDFGPDDFRERLMVWLAAADEDGDLNAVGRAGFFTDCVRYATNRLRIHELLKRHPEIHDIEISQPIVVAGLPRSGTTHLLNLISADTRLRSLPYWESLEPVPAPEDKPGADGIDPRLARAAQAWELTEALMPYIVAMHPLTPTHVHEEIELQGPDFSSYLPEWVAHVPRWRDYYLSHDQTPHYEYMKTVLKILQWYRGPDRWVLKSPQHMEQLGPLLTTFPDATVVITHRDPVAVIQSAATMLAYGDRVRRRRVDSKAVLDYWSDRVETLLGACVRDRELVPAGQSIDVLFHEFMADDVGMVGRIYNTAGLPMNDSARAELDDYMAKHPRGVHGRVAYDLKRDFGVDPAVLRRRFDFYFERFSVRAES